MSEFTAEVYGDPGDYTVVTKALLEEIGYQWNRFPPVDFHHACQCPHRVEQQHLGPHLLAS